MGNGTKIPGEEEYCAYDANDVWPLNFENSQNSFFAKVFRTDDKALCCNICDQTLN